MLAGLGARGCDPMSYVINAGTPDGIVTIGVDVLSLGSELRFIVRGSLWAMMLLMKLLTTSHPKLRDFIPSPCCRLGHTW